MRRIEVELSALATHLGQRRDAILRAWRAAVAADPALTTGAALPRAQLHDHLPALLVDFERTLATYDPAAASRGSSAQQRDAAAHGLHRWQQGFDLEEVTRELARLNECVVVELEDYAAANVDLDPAVMAAARRIWARQCGDSISASTSQYFRLQQMEAGGHVRDLEQALDALRELESRQAEQWEQAAHDLRGNLGVVSNVSAVLASPKASDGVRENFLRLLDRNVSALHHLLDDVTSLARLQGGQERRSVAPMDATSLLRDLCESVQAQAENRGLYLRFEGPAKLEVQGDRVKTRRITQNLILNAIKYTRQGGVTVSWGASAADDAGRWFVQVRDTGPGFHAGPGSLLAGALEVATDQAKKVAADNDSGHVHHAAGDPCPGDEPVRDRRAVQQAAGEGIGLSIVKRLCELLNATMELQSTIGVGTAVRILLPRDYAD